jgi:hypothetical protein
MTLLHGVDRDAAGAVSQTATGTIAPQGGMPVAANGELRTTTIAGAPPVDSTVRHGQSYAADGSLHVTADAIEIVRGGVAYTLAGALCITVSAPANSSKYAYVRGIGVALVDTGGRMHVS